MWRRTPRSSVTARPPETCAFGDGRHRCSPSGLLLLDGSVVSRRVADARLAVATTYVLEPGRITRTDIYTPKGPIDLTGIELDFGSFSEDLSH